MSPRPNREVSGAAVVGMLLSIPFLAIFNGWVIKTAWNWFIPEITGWPRLGVLQAIGVAIVIQIAWPRRYRTEEERDQTAGELAQEILTHAVTMLFTLGLGFIVHELMT